MLIWHSFWKCWRVKQQCMRQLCCRNLVRERRGSLQSMRARHVVHVDFSCLVDNMLELCRGHVLDNTCRVYFGSMLGVCGWNIFADYRSVLNNCLQ